MILADTSIWIDHLRSGHRPFAVKLQAAEVLCHPMIVTELALGSLANRAEVLGLLDQLPTVTLAQTVEVRALIEARALYSRGIGFVDASLIAACLLTPGTTLWTSEKRLHTVAADLGLAPRKQT